MIAVIFNYVGDMEAVKEQFPNIPFTTVPEMIDGTYMIPLNTPEDFTPIGDFMVSNGTLTVIAGWNKEGKKDAFKDVAKQYDSAKYKKYLRDRWNYDADGNKTTKVTKEAWQVNKYLGWGDRDVSETLFK